MSIRYPDLGEPVVTKTGPFKVVSVMSGEFVECCFCFAVVRKERAQGHSMSHEITADRLFNLKKALSLLIVSAEPTIKWLDEVWSKKPERPNTGRLRS